jgi:hypothetical protein
VAAETLARGGVGDKEGGEQGREQGMREKHAGRCGERLRLGDSNESGKLSRGENQLILTGRYFREGVGRGGQYSRVSDGEEE